MHKSHSEYLEETSNSKAAKVTNVLIKISNAVNTTSDLGELYKYIYALLGEIVDVRNFVVGLYNSQEDSISYPFYVDEKGDVYNEIYDVSKSSILAWEVISSKKPFFINKAQGKARLRQLKQELVGEPSEQWLGVPLKIENDVIGVMVVQSYDDPELYDKQDAEILLTISNQVALSIESKRKEEARKQSQARIHTLYEISNAVNTTFNLNDLYLSIHKSLAIIINVKNFFIAIYSNETDSLIFPYFVDQFDEGNPRAFREIKNVQNTESLTCEVIRTGEPLFLKDAFAGKGTKSKAWLGVPLKIKTDIIGVMATQSYENSNEYSAEDFDVFSSVSDQVALAIDRKRKEKELNLLNKELENKVIERTEQLEAVQKKALDNAHKAGMAEIATDTIHNVGNVLNSVKTSSQIVLDLLKSNSSFDDFKKVSDLLKKNIDQIDEFVSTPQAVSLLQFVNIISPKIFETKLIIEENMNRLLKGIDNIEDVITTQQSFTGYSAHQEDLSAKFIEDALSIQSGTIEKHRIEIIKEYEDVPKVLVVKTKLIHILINLIKNAKDAMQNFPPGQRKIFISLSAKRDAVHLKIRDTGEGIPEENLTKIFNHGFTTKKNGHGFGLHSCANYMTEMRGKMIVRSDNQKLGSTFILVFPLNN